MKNVPLEVLRFILNESKGLGVNAPVLAKYWAKIEGQDPSSRRVYNRYIKRVTRLAEHLSKHGYAEVKCVDGLTWIKLTRAGVDLISIVSKTQTLSAHEGVRRKHPEKVEARNFLKNKRKLEAKDWGVLYQHFENYLSDVDNKIVVLEDPEFGSLHVVRVKHRFRKYRLIELIHKYREVWDKARQYQVGVFITLTMNPAVYPHLVSANYMIAEAFNRFISYLRRRHKDKRIVYIAVLEYQDSGNPHLHVVIFGISRIMDHYRLTSYLVRWGFGPIHYEYKIVNRGGKWIWADSKPRGLQSSVSDYLEKYLKKTFDSVLNDIEISSYSNPTSVDISNMKVSLYWALDKRFFTYSRVLAPEPLPHSPMGLVFIWAGYWFECPDPIYEDIKDVIHMVLGPPS